MMVDEEVVAHCGSVVEFERSVERCVELGSGRNFSSFFSHFSRNESTASKS